MNSNTDFSDRSTSRKRKASKSTSSTSCSSVDSESDSSGTESRKIARLNSCIRHSHHPQNNSGIVASTSKLVKSRSENNDEKCPICFKILASQVSAITDTCSYHTFCLDCLEEWSKTRKTCPVDRKEYTSILVLDSSGNVSKQLPIKSNLSTSFNSEAPTFCEICGLLIDTELMLICDNCSAGFHLYCLMPPMDSSPSGIWLCDDCWCFFNY